MITHSMRAAELVGNPNRKTRFRHPVFLYFCKIITGKGEECMYPNEQRYKRVMLRVGFAMLLHALLVNVLSVVQEFLLNPVFAALLDARRADVAQQLAEGVVYLTAFMLPGFFFYWISRKEDREPLPLKTVLTPRTPLVVMAGMAAILVFAMINAVAVSFFSVNDASQYVIGMEAKENYQVVLLFIRIAVIPAVCEEFLFRGVIQTNLMPFGRTAAIIASAALFGLMHANSAQFLYAVIAGVILGVVRDRTGSIWCGIVIHFCNNFFSVLQTALSDRLPIRTADTVMYLLEGFLVAAGLVCGIILILLREKDKKPEAVYEEGTFGQDVEPGDSYADYPLESGRAVALFFNVPVVLFCLYAVGSAVLLVILPYIQR